MNSAKGFFVLACMILFIILPFFIKKRRLYFLGLAASLYVFQSGWIFYHLNGIMFADIPIFILLVMAFGSGKKVDLLLLPIGLSILLFIGWCLITTVGAKQPGWVVSEATKYFRMYLLIVGIVNNIHGMREVRVIVLGMFIALLFESFLAIYQWKFGALGIWYLGERSARRIGWRTMGTFFVPSFYGNYLSLMLPMAFLMAMFLKVTKKIWISFFLSFIIPFYFLFQMIRFIIAPKKYYTYIYKIVIFYGFVALFTTYARAPWIAFVLSLVIIFIWGLIKIKLKSQSIFLLVVIIMYGGAFFARYHSAIINQFGSSRKASTEVRYPQFRIAERVIKSNPIIGIGLGNYEMNSWDYMTPEELRNPIARNWAMMVHNAYLLITTESGYVGGALLIIWLLSIFWMCLQILRSRIINEFITIVTLGIFGGMFGICLIFTFSPDIHAYPILYQIGLFCGLLIGMKNIIKNVKNKMHSLVRYRQYRIRSNQDVNHQIQINDSSEDLK